MDVITIESQAFSKLLTLLETLAREIQTQNKTQKPEKSSPSEKLAQDDRWLDNEDLCRILKVTKRTLQNYRDNFILPYTQIGRKIYYKYSDVQTILQKNYIALDSP